MPSPDQEQVLLLALELRYEHDVVLARQRTRQLAEALGFDVQDQIRLATAISELARNAFQYAGGGSIRFHVESSPREPRMLVAQVRDTGPGIPDVKAVLDGHYVSPTGLGLGITGARRLSERFRLESSRESGTIVEIARSLPATTPPITPGHAAHIAAELDRVSAPGPFEEIRQQNHELVRALDELRIRQTEVERLNVELEETNRGVLALYAELDDRAQELRRGSEIKSRFLSDMSHELRTPLTSVLNLSNILLAGTDGPLAPEQEYQVRLIRRSIESVTELVNDLLDLAKIEAGKTQLRLAEFRVADLFSSLRGVCRPLLANDTVALQFDDASQIPAMVTDEGRLAQVLRNFLSNAIKYTERGSVTVRGELAADDCVQFTVIDSGIGIAPEDLDRVFDDYTQVDGPIQRRVRGTGLGLPLTRKLAALLCGSVGVRSTVGQGSTFTLTIPRVHPDASDDERASRVPTLSHAPRADQIQSHA